jgi:prepilin-type processing-associated H-X9-DG protein
VFLLPFLEQASLHEKLDFNRPPYTYYSSADGTQNYANTNVYLSFLNCPSDKQLDTNLRTTSYLMVRGSHQVSNPSAPPTLESAKGMFGIYRVRIQDVTDGTANTLAYAEVDHKNNYWESASASPSAYTVLTSTPAPATLSYRGSNWAAKIGRNYIVMGRPPNFNEPDFQRDGSCPHCTDTVNGLSGSGVTNSLSLPTRSRHPGGANGLLADGSVRFLANTMTMEVSRALGTMDGDEVFDMP